MLISFDMETGKAECSDPLDDVERASAVLVRQNEPLLGLQLLEYDWDWPAARDAQ